MANPITWAVEKIRYCNDLLWHTPFSQFTKRRLFLVKQVRVIYVAIRGFIKDKVQTQASALTLNTLLAIVPVVAIAFAIAKGFGLDQNLIDALRNEFSSQQQILDWLVNLAQNALQQTKGGYLAGIGAVILVYSVMSLLANVETSFNHIWQTASRPFNRKFTDYLAIMIITPAFLILSTILTVFLSSKINGIFSSAPLLETFKPVTGFLLKLVPFILTCLILTIIYIVIPNTKVAFVPALVGGLIAGIALKLLQWVYLDLQMGITRLSAIYGSFAAIPLLIIWLQTSWIIILLGAELSFANQNLAQYEQEAEALKISNFQKRSLSVMLMHKICSNFSEGIKPISAVELAENFNLPIRLVREMLENLHDVNLLSEIVDDKEKETFYQPAIDINKITVGSVLSKLDKHGADTNLEIDNLTFDTITDLIKKSDKRIYKTDLDILVKDI